MYFYFQRARYLERELQLWRNGVKTVQNPAGNSTPGSTTARKPSTQPDLPEVTMAPTPGPSDDVASSRAPRRSVIADNSSALNESVPDVSNSDLPSPQLRGPEVPASEGSVLPGEAVSNPSDSDSGPITELPSTARDTNANDSPRVAEAETPAPARDPWAERERRNAARQQSGSSQQSLNGMPADSDYARTARSTNATASDTNDAPRAATTNRTPQSTPRTRSTPPRTRGPIRSIYDAPEAMPQ
jgi:hypothetical protein